MANHYLKHFWRSRRSTGMEDRIQILAQLLLLPLHLQMDKMPTWLFCYEFCVIIYLECLAQGRCLTNLSFFLLFNFCLSHDPHSSPSRLGMIITTMPPPPSQGSLEGKVQRGLPQVWNFFVSHFILKIQGDFSFHSKVYSCLFQYTCNF